ncbi:MAG: chromosome segregation protein SMC [Acidobacteria bacterium]|nr:chromosome segregation protein SMC [Acidobacteriota bacterium]
MHRIESLELFGFKSFRDKVRIEFKGDISAIVGPNGCGKSNICDAFLWVMGEQSARVLRGKRMEDVIFNGTERLRPTSFTEVALQLKYEEKPGEEDLLAREDLEIMRRLYRDGTSEYFMNGRRCRLLDIHATFEGTGLGFTSYAIIEQGRIQNITASKPLELRALIEEAARIVSFKQRKRAALLKLEMAEQNLVRIRDIIQEIERGLRALKVQVRKARRYNALREKMRIFLKIRYFKSAANLRVEFQEIRGRMLATQETLAEVESEYGEGVRSLHAGKENLTEAEARCEELNQQEKEVDLTLQQITTSRTFLREQRENLLERKENLRNEEARIQRRLDEQHQEQQVLEKRIQELNNLQQKAHERFLAAENRFRQQAEVLGRKEKELEEIRDIVFEEAGLLANWRNQETQLQEEEKWLAVRRKKLETELDDYTAHAGRIRGQAEQLRDDLDDLRGEMDELESRQTRLEEDRADHRERLRELQERLGTMVRDVDASRHRLSSLEELEARHEFYSEAVREFLPLFADHPGFRGTLADFLEAGEGFESVVENFLRNELEIIVCDSIDLVAKGLDHFRAQRSGICHFLVPIDGDLPPAAEPAPLHDHPGVLGRLLDVLQTSAEGRLLLARSIPQVENIWLVKEWRTALDLAGRHLGVTCLSLDGVAVSSSGRVTVHGAPTGKGILGYRSEKKELLKSLQTGEKELDRLEDAVTEATTTMAAIEADLEEAEEGRQNFQTRQIRLQEAVNRHQDDQVRYEKLAATAGAELDNIKVDEERVQREMDNIRGRIQEISANQQFRQEEYERCREEIAALKEETTGLNREYAECRTEFSTARERVNSVAGELRQLAHSVEDMENQLANLERDRQKIITQLERIDADLAAADERSAEAVHRRAALEESLAGQRDKISAVRFGIETEENRLEEIRRKLQELRDEKNQHEVQRVKLESEQQHLQEACLAEFHQSIDDITIDSYEEERELSAEAAYNQYLALRGRAESMGSVNLIALEEYEREEERLNFHQEQERDIAESIAATQNAIQEIDQRSARLFQSTFEHINANFKEMFTYLFGGGTCELRLEDEENILESGVEIVASPPGKKLQNILLLSGGEKALAALALLLALFKYRPSPFCILDEVDAPLDDNNIDRFVFLVKKMSANTQYILITHNKRTMEIGETIYGITMEQAGISKVLSVRLKDVDQVLPAASR